MPKVGDFLSGDRLGCFNGVTVKGNFIILFLFRKLRETVNYVYENSSMKLENEWIVVIFMMICEKT